MSKYLLREVVHLKLIFCMISIIKGNFNFEVSLVFFMYCMLLLFYKINFFFYQITIIRKNSSQIFTAFNVLQYEHTNCEPLLL